MKLTDNIIDTYIRHPKTGPQAETSEFSQLSERFHEVFKLEVEKAKLRGDIELSLEPITDFWRKWEANQI